VAGNSACETVDMKTRSQSVDVKFECQRWTKDLHDAK